MDEITEAMNKNENRSKDRGFGSNQHLAVGEIREKEGRGVDGEEGENPGAYRLPKPKSFQVGENAHNQIITCFGNAVRLKIKAYRVMSMFKFKDVRRV